MPHSTCGSHTKNASHVSCLCIVCMPHVPYKSTFYVGRLCIICTLCVPNPTQTKSASQNEVSSLAQFLTSPPCCCHPEASLRGSSLLVGTFGLTLKGFSQLSRSLLFPLLAPAHSGDPPVSLLMSCLCEGQRARMRVFIYHFLPDSLR